MITSITTQTSQFKSIIAKTCCLLIVSFGILCAARAQNISETQWFFGQSTTNLQFDKNAVNVYEEDRMNANFGTGGPTVISNPYNGNLLFYSDGQFIYDASHTDILQSQFGITGNPDVNQAVVSMPHPADSAKYFLFINNTSSIYFALLDANRQGNGTPDVNFGEIETGGDLGIANPSEGLIIVPDFTQSNYWLISQNNVNYDFNVTQINAAGIGATRVFALDTSTQIPGFEAAHFDFNSDSSLLAVAPKDPNRNILLLNFNRATGDLSVNRQLRNTGFSDNAGESIYDVAWSSNGSKLYYSRFGSTDTLTANIYQFDLTDTINRATRILGRNIFRSYGLKKGIDNRIYHLYQIADGDPVMIGRISNLDSLASNVAYEVDYFTTDFNGRQFPSFADPKLSANLFSMDIIAYETCVGNSTKFFPIVRPVPNSYSWDIGGFTSNQAAPIVSLQTPGAINVSLTVELNGLRQTYLETVTIGSINEQVDLGNDTTICVNDPPLDIPTDPLSFQNDPGATFLWSTGSSAAQIQVDTAGLYWVEVTFSNGCTQKDYIQVTEYGVNTNLRNQWYFGEKAGLDFNDIDGLPPPPRALNDGAMDAPEGCATVSDFNGELLFYTDGDTIWNKSHELMLVYDTTGGISLGGNENAAQGAMILPFMGDSTMYYVFSTREVDGSGNYGISYSIVDMKEDSAKGAVVVKNIPLADQTTEKITASGFRTSSWLAMHEFGNNNFRTHLVTTQGIGAVVHTPMGEVLDERFPERADGYMNYNAGFPILFTNVIPGVNQFEVFDFNATEGRLSNPRLIETNESQPLYGVSFSAGNRKLYLSTTNNLLQYDLDSLDTPNEIDEITNSKFYLAQNSSNVFGSIQQAPNGLLYVAVENNPSVHYIQNSDADDAAANYNTTGTDLGGAHSRRGLPNYIYQDNSNSQQPTIAYLNACLGQQTEFIATGTDPIDEFFWTLEDALVNGGDTTLNGENVFYEYPTAGPRVVQLEISNRCNYREIFTDTITVYSIPEQPILPDETNLCAADSLVVELWFEDRNDLSFNWFYFDPRIGSFVRDTSRALTIDESLVPTGTIRDFEGWIVNADGCRSDTLQFTSSNNRPYVFLGFDQDICQYTDAPDVDANVSGVTFQWWINGTQQSNLDQPRYQPISTQNAGLLEYVVRIREPFFGCTQTDTLQVNIQEAPRAVGRVIPPTICGAQDAVLSFDVNTDGTFLYNIEGDNLLDAGAVNGPGPSLDYSGLGTGIYQLDLENIVTGCTASQPLLIEDDVPFDLSAANLPDCQEDISLQMTLSGTQLPEFVRIYITDVIGDTIFYEPETTVPIRLFPPGLADGQYNVTVIDRETGCIQADTVLIQPLFAAEEDCQPEIFAPTAFSPNGNGQNEEFFIYPNAFIEEFEIFIYSRWGELVYYSKDPYFKWDGIYKGQILGPGTFAYVIKFTSSEQPALGTLSQYGSITIIQ